MSRFRRSRLSLLCFAWLLLRSLQSLPGEPQSPFGSTKITADNHFIRSEEIRNRIEVQSGELAFFGLDVRRGRHVEYQALGFSSPYLTAGPVVPKGLLREIFNPLSYGPGSSVFTEAPELRIDKSFGGSGKTGLSFDPVPGHAAAFLFHSSGVTKGGGSLNIPLAGTFSTHLLMTTSQPARDPPEESWFHDSLRFPGERLLHGAGRIVLDHPGLHGSFSLAVSGGRRIVPGSFVLADVALKTGVFRPELLIGISSPRYFNPDGEWCERGLSGGLALTLVPTSDLEIQGQYLARFDHPSGWESALSRYLSFEDKKRGLSGSECYEIGLEAECDLGGDIKLIISPGFESDIQRSGSGRPSRADAWYASATIDAEVTEMTVGYTKEENHQEAQVSIDYDVVPEAIGLSLSVVQPLSPPRMPDVDFRLELISETHRVFIRIEQTQGESLLSLGLESEIKA
jgi:hypothetical protein